MGIIPTLSYIKEIPKLVQDIYECSQIGNSIEMAPYINQEYCKPILAEYGEDYDKYGSYVNNGVNTFIVHLIPTILTPQQWVLQNVSYQGEKWNESMGTGKDIKVNDYTFFSLDVSCCGGYEQVYLYPYNTTGGQKVLLAFITNNRYGLGDIDEQNKSDKNVVLDKILSTLRIKK